MWIGMSGQQSRGDGDLLAIAPHPGRIAGAGAADQRDLLIKKDFIGAHGCAPAASGGTICPSVTCSLDNRQVMGWLYTHFPFSKTQFGIPEAVGKNI
jgi:hypothetical protein